MRNDPSLVGRVSIITGASRGLGKEMALALVEAGGKVALTGRSISADMKDALRNCAPSADAIAPSA